MRGQLPGRSPPSHTPTSSARAVHQMSVMLSHLHAALRVEAETAPLEIAFCYRNNLAQLLRL